MDENYPAPQLEPNKTERIVCHGNFRDPPSLGYTIYGTEVGPDAWALPCLAHINIRLPVLPVTEFLLVGRLLKLKRR
ncbi:MAG: hypothetical protein E4G90_08745 [Gemmatimonadales bacterium]|nr:MAG: hypothetical protein E4G90_08745 [Gemmatimonadales bacterium]